MVVGDHHRGQVMEGSRVFVLLEGINLAVVVEMGEGDSWEMA